jgi:short-subunit dehydrogenase
MIIKETGYVLITGASTGIGYEMAKVFARKSYNLVLIARSEERLIKMADEFSAAYGIHTVVIVKDLALMNSAAEVFQEIQKLNLKVEILINNAGFGNIGFFHETAFQRELEMIQLNITTLTQLTKLFAQTMVQNKHGKILNVASTGSYQPGPLFAVYYATKAYVLSFSEAIANELKPFGVSVSILCPGATKSEFAKNAGKVTAKSAMEARSVAEIAYRGLMKKKTVIIPGIYNKIFIFATRILPRNISANLIRRMQISTLRVKHKYKN